METIPIQGISQQSPSLGKSLEDLDLITVSATLNNLFQRAEKKRENRKALTGPGRFDLQLGLLSDDLEEMRRGNSFYLYKNYLI